MTLKIGEVCAGYGGLGLAVEEVFNAELAWVSEFEEAPSKILAHHWPDAPNHGDMTKIDWAAIEPVDIISGGTPCQDLSHAGRRAGMTDGTRSNLWVQMREAIATIRPTYVVWENVRGAYSAEADSSLEQCPGCMGDTTNGRVLLRALGRVLGDLSDLGYDCQWRGLRAADVGAPHGRFRVFVLATLRAANDHSSGGRNQALERNGGGSQTHDRAGVPDESDRDSDGAGPEREVTADAGSEAREQWPRLREGESVRGGRRRSANDGREKTTSIPTGERGREGRAEHARLKGRSHAQLGSDALAADATSSEWRGPEPDHLGQGQEPAAEPGERTGEHVAWGEYEPAIRRWEAALGRRAPAPTEPTGRNGGHRLSARFAEWMMGVPDGWIVDVPGISRNEALKAAGNGVVPQQAAAALRHMLNHSQRKEVT